MMQSSQQDAEREASNGNGIAFSDAHVSLLSKLA